MKSLAAGLILLMVAVWLVVPGCGGSDHGTSTDVKPQAEYKKEAAKQITPENAEAELEKMRKEIESDKE